jgi:hypothetical protein
MWPFARPRNSRLIVPGMTGVLLMALVTLVGCVEVSEVDTTPAASTPDAFASPLPGVEHHNLAVLTVDFDPPLDYQQLIVHRQSVTLLVAVENTGSHTQRDVTVRAELSTPEDTELLLTRGASVESIAPGEIQVVRFARLGEIPYHQIYHLEVIVDPVEGERDLSDNLKAFDIQILQQ